MEYRVSSEVAMVLRLVFFSIGFFMIWYGIGDGRDGGID